MVNTTRCRRVRNGIDELHISGYERWGGKMIAARKIGAAHIFALGDSFHDVLRRLSADYFEQCYARMCECLSVAEVGATPSRWGWVHPGYGVLFPDWQTPDLDEPAQLFGWVSQSSLHEPADNAATATLAAALRSRPPRLHWATCSARGYRYDSLAADDFQQGTELFVEFAVYDPAEWSIATIAPDGAVPDFPWKRLCFAAAHGDTSMLKETWQIARSTYTKAAIRLLERGVQQTQRCFRPD